DPVEKKIMTPYFPLGLMYLASVLRKNGYEVELFDCTFRKDFDEFENYLKTRKPKVVGITSLITIRRNALIIADIAHRYGAKVILGGPDPTALPERYLLYKGTNGDFPVDVVVFDEGEITMLELANFYFKKDNFPDDIREIPGLRLRDENGNIIATKHRELIQDLDSIPFPARDLVDMDDYRKAWKKKHGYWSLTIINSRGCP
ncbi:MAG: cobalamin-dependent protein, partial [Candidatus Kryptonium sp.]